MSAGDGIRYPVCACDTKVTETRQNRGSLRRRRRCLDDACLGRVTTIEMVAPKYSKNRVVTTNLRVVPTDNSEHEVVPRALMHALRELLSAQDVGTASPDEHW